MSSLLSAANFSFTTLAFKARPADCICPRGIVPPTLKFLIKPSLSKSTDLISYFPPAAIISNGAFPPDKYPSSNKTYNNTSAGPMPFTI